MNTNSSNTDKLFGNVIFAYTTAQAIEDGVLIEASPNTHPGWLLSEAVFERIKEVEGFTDADVYGLGWKQRVVPLLMDAAMIIAARPDDYLWTKGLEGNLTNRPIWIARNDLGGFTLMFPEDY